MLRSLPGTVPDCNFSLDIVEVMHDVSRMMSNEVSTVIDNWFYTMYICVTFIGVFVIIYMKIPMKV